MSEPVLTTERSPSEPLSFADGVGTWAEIEIEAGPAEVFADLVSLASSGHEAAEYQSGRWVLDEGAEPGVGARFVGANENAHLGAWEIDCFVTDFEPGRTFAWVTADPAAPGASWRYDLTETDAGRTHVRHSAVLGPGRSGLTDAIEARPDAEEKILRFRIRDHHANMGRTLEALKTRIESGSAAT